MSNKCVMLLADAVSDKCVMLLADVVSNNVPLRVMYHCV